MKHIITMLLLVASLWAGVNINTASEEELATVKGIGAKTAQAIIAGRPYKNLDELMKVKGIGAKKLEKIQKDLEI